MQDDTIEQPSVAETIEAPKEEVESSGGTIREELQRALKEANEKPSRERDEVGRFSKAEKKEEAEKVVEVKKYTAPQSWKDEFKPKFETIDPLLQAEIARREEEMEKALKNQDEERLFGKQLKETITPYLPIIQAEGGTPASAVKDLLNTAYVLRSGTQEQKRQLILRTAQQYGVDLGQVSQPQSGDPQIQSLMQEIESLKQSQNALGMREQQQLDESINGQINAFASDPNNPHFQAVKADMGALIQTGRAKDLKEAYDMAVWANPQTRSTLLEAQTAESEAKRVAEIKAKADAARRAGSSVTGAPGATAPKNLATSDRSLREELQAAFAAHG